MSPLPTLTATASAPAPRAGLGLCAAGNANHSRTLDDERDGDPRLRPGNGAHRRSGRMSQFDTAESAPLWNGPRLRPAFVAQVLGQVMMDARDQALDAAPAAYAKAARLRPGARLDGSI